MINRQMLKQIRALVDEFYEINKGQIDLFHKQKKLMFYPMPISGFAMIKNTGKSLHKSKVYNGKQSSEYALGYIPSIGIVYARKSNHWGNFSTRDKTRIDETDPYQRGIQINHQWDLFGKQKFVAFEHTSDDGDIHFRKTYPKISQAGYIVLEHES